MELAARTGAWHGGGSVPTARDYVQNGLVAMWDGIENAGWGVHDPTATVWKDLIGDYSFVNFAGTWRGDHAYYKCIWNGSTLKEQQLNRVGVPQSFVNSVQSYAAVGAAEIKETKYHNYAPRVDFLQIRSTVAYTRRLLVSIGSNDSRKFDSSGHRYKYCKNFSLDKDDDTTHSYQANWLSNGSNLWVDGNIISNSSYDSNGWGKDSVSDVNVGCYSSGYYDFWSHVRLYNVRLYNRNLSDAEIAANYAIDKARFNLT